MKYVLPIAAKATAIYFPAIGGAMAASSVVTWEVKKILQITKEIKESIDRLMISDYKTAMVLFKHILISLTSNVYPKLTDIDTLNLKAIEGYHMLDDMKIEEKLELIKIQMFCTIYRYCYDEDKGTIIAYQNVSDDHKDIIHKIFDELLKDIQNLSAINRLDYYAENSSSSSKKGKYQKMVDAIDHIKKTSYSHMIIKDDIHQVKGFAVKIWSLKSYMVPEGEADALYSSMNLLKSTNGENVTIQASIFTDKKNTWFLKIHLPSDIDYEDVAVICKLQREDMEPALFFPSRVDNIMWKVDTSFLSKPDGIISFFILKPGIATVPNAYDEHDGATASLTMGYGADDDYLPLYGLDEINLMKDGFQTSRTILESISHSVATTVSLMNLTNTTINLCPPAMTSGYPCEETPWPKEVPAFKLTNLVLRKAKMSVKGCVGATLFALSTNLHILFYWSTPFDQNFYKNCFGVGYYSGDTLAHDDLLDKIYNIPQILPKDLNFNIHQAEEGPVCINVTNNWWISVNMTTARKAAIEVILFNDLDQNN